MSDYKLTAELRDVKGSVKSRQLRADKLVPAQ